MKASGGRLDGRDAVVLAQLDEAGGITTRQVAEAVRGNGGNMRKHSALMRCHLVDLKKRGLAALLDDQKPDAWIRTKRGSEMLREMGEEEEAHRADQDRSSAAPVAERGRA